MAKMYNYRIFEYSEGKEIADIEVNNPISVGEYVITPETLLKVKEVVHKCNDQLLINGFHTRLIVEVIQKK